MTTAIAMRKKTGFVGRTRNGDRIWLELELRLKAGGFQTVEHEYIGAYTELSVCAAGLRKGSRRGYDIDFGGQSIEAFRDVVLPANGWSVAVLREIADVWENWHLNGLKPGCAHMPEGVALHTPCPVQMDDIDIEEPYQYGHAWLVEPLPDAIIDKVTAWASRLDGDYPC